MCNGIPIMYGVCLDGNGRRDQLLISEVDSIEGTGQIMATADRIIRP